jgi:hypothetical protein
MADYKELTDYLRNKYENAALEDSGDTRINAMLASGAGHAAAPVSTQTDLVKKEINDYFDINKPKEYEQAIGVEDALTGEAMMRNNRTGEFGKVVDGKWVPSNSVTNTTKPEDPNAKARLALEERRVQALENKAMRGGDGGVSAALAFQMGKDTRDSALREEETRLKREKEARELANPKLSVDQQKLNSNISMGLSAVEDMKKALEAGTNTFSIIGDNEFTEAQRRASEAFGRLQSGGAINKDEEQRFIDMGPRPRDSKAIQMKKLENQKQEYISRMKQARIDPVKALSERSDSPTTAPTTASSATPPPNEVERMSGGKPAIFNADTKQFIRWK